jgi:hypothetical protein
MAYKKKDERTKNEQHESRLKNRVGLMENLINDFQQAC